MNEFLKALKEGLVWIAKSISEDKMDDAVESIEKLSKTLEQKAEEIQKTEDDDGSDDDADAGDGDGSDGNDQDTWSQDAEEVKKTIDEAVKKELKKYADLYISASDVKQLIKDLMDAFKTEVTKTIEEKVWSVSERVEKIENAKPSKQLDDTDGDDDKPKWVSKIFGWDILNPYGNQ